MRSFSNARKREKDSLSETNVSWVEIQIFLLRKDWAKSVPAAAVIPIVQMMIYTGFKTCEARREIILLSRESNLVNFIGKIKNRLNYHTREREMLGALLKERSNV